MKKILIVDDSAFMRGVLKDILLNKNNESRLIKSVEIMESNGKIDALRQIKRTAPDVILLDIIMGDGDMEGIELVDAIKNTYDTKKIIVITSIGQPFLTEKCKRLGINYYLQKPFEHKQIIECVNTVLL